MVGPRRTCTIVDAGVRKPLDLHIHVPVESMVEPEQRRRPRPARPARRRRGDAPLDLAGDLPASCSSSSASTARRSSSSTTAAAPSAWRCGSTSWPTRRPTTPPSRSPAPTTARWRARSARSSRRCSRPASCRAWSRRRRWSWASTWAPSTSCCRSSRRSPSPRGLQRIGRAGHNVGDSSKGRIFPKFRADLLECAVVAKLMREGRIEPTVVPRNALDVLAQQIVAIAASAGGRAGRRRRALRARHAHVLLRRAAARRCWRTCSTCSTAATRRRSSPSCARASCGTASRGTIRAAQGRAPARGDQRRHDPRPRPVLGHAARRPARRRARRGDGLRGAARADVPARRVDVADRGDRPRPRDRHARARRAGRGAVLEGRRRRPARRSWARRSARSAAGPSTRRPRCSSASYDLDALAAQEPPRLPARAAGRHARRARATARSSSSASATRSATGGCACSRPTAGACTRPGALALSARHPRRATAWSPTRSGPTTGSSSTSPTPTSRPGADLVLIEPDELEDLVVGELGGSALFGARFRENAGRALLIPRAYPGKRTPLWQQRLKSQSLLEVAKRYARLPDHPRDLPRVPARRARPAGPAGAAARAAPPRAVAGRGRDADRVAVRLVAAVRLRRDVHVRGRHAQRRAPRRRAVARPRPAARAARPGGAARPDRPRRAATRSRPTSSTARTARAPRRATRSPTCCAASAT